MNHIDFVKDSFVWWRDKNDYSIKASYKTILEAAVVVSCFDAFKTLVSLWKSKSSE